MTTSVTTRSGRRRPASAGLLVTALTGVLAGGCSSAAGPAPIPVRSAAASRPDSGPRSAGEQTYGNLPSWLPAATVLVDRVVTASAAHPRLGIEGDTMAVVLPAGRVTVTVVGPSVPEEGRFPIPASTRCTFTVTMSGATAAVPVVAGQWTATDERSLGHHLRVVSLTGGSAPRVVKARSTVSFALVTDLPPGSGALSWAPAGGAQAGGAQVGGAQVGTWEFDVELD